MNYLELIEARKNDMLYVIEAQQGVEPYTPADIESQARTATLGDILGIVTYDHEYEAKLIQIVVEVIDAITERTTFEYMEKGTANYENYLMVVNLAFFKDKLEWGTSIRDAWWDGKLYDGAIFTSANALNREEWSEYMRAVVAFAKEESK